MVRVGGTVQGLLSPSGLDLSEGAELLVVASDGPFSFGTTRPAGSTYEVAVTRQPVEPWQTCAVARGNGTLGTSDVTDVQVTCITNRYAIGGSVAGLAGAQGLVLGNDGERLPINADGSFEFTTPVASGAAYEVSIASQPTGATCSVSRAAGTVQGAAVADVAVQCAAVAYRIGGTITGLAPQAAGTSGLVLQSGGDRLALFGSGTFTFPTPVPHGGNYAVSINVQPGAPVQTCVVDPATAYRIGVTADVTDVQVSCLTPTASGAFDTTFGDNGIARIDFEARLSADTLPVLLADADGRLVLAGTTDASASKDFALLRLTNEGRLDTTFNGGSNGGFVRTNLSASGNSQDQLRAIGRQSDGRIVVAGYTGVFDFALARYTADGALDTTFGSGGIVITHINLVDYAYALAIDAADRIVVAGTTFPNGTLPGEDFLIARYTADGRPDTTFNGGDAANTTGRVRTDFGANDRALAVAVQPDGRIVAAGYGGRIADFALVRYLDDGRLDTSFGTAGTGLVTTVIKVTDHAAAMRLQPTGEIVLGGYTTTSTGHDFALARYTAAGVLDTSFGNGGIVITDLGSLDDRINALAIDALGRIVAAGHTSNGHNTDIAVVRYLANGAPDPTFAASGVLRSAVGGADESLSSVLVLADGSIVVAGHSEHGSAGAGMNVDFIVLRIVP